MIARWHLDLLALSVAVGLVAVLIEARGARDGEPTNTSDAPGIGPVRIPPAAVVGIALLLAGVFDLVDVPAFAALTLLAGFIGCRHPAVTAIVAALFLAVPAVEGFSLPTWLLVLLAVVLLALVPTAHPPVNRFTDRIDTATETSAVVPLLIAAALWTAAPDTELPLAAGGALLAPAARDLVGRRSLRPDAPALMAVTVAAALGFVGRPAGAVVLTLVAPIAWIAAGPPTRLRTGATALSVGALVLACRTGGLRHHVGRALVPTALAGLIVLAILIAVLLTERDGATDRPAHQQP